MPSEPKESLLLSLDEKLDERGFLLDAMPPLYHRYQSSDSGTIEWWAEQRDGELCLHAESWREEHILRPQKHFVVFDTVFQERQLTFPAFIVLTREMVSACLHMTDSAADYEGDFVRSDELADAVRSDDGYDYVGSQLLVEPAEQPSWNDVLTSP